jgi:protein XagA
MRRILFRLGKIFQLASLAFGLGPVAPAMAGAWNPEAGHGEIIVTTLFDSADASFNQSGHFTPTPLYRSLQAIVFVDYGVTDWLAALIRPALQSSSLGAPDNQRYTGLGDSEIGAQARLWRDDSSVVAAQVSMQAPTNGGVTNSWLQGARQPEYDFRLLLGKSLAIGGLWAFIDLEAGYRLCVGPAPNEARFDLSFGLYATPQLMLLVQSFNIVSAASSNADYPQWAQYKAQVSLVYSLNPDWRAQLGGYTTMAGKNAYRENGVLVAVWRQF